MIIPDDSEKENILAALRAYHGGKIYLMGSPGLVKVGFDLHHDNEVTSLEWAKNFTCLYVRIGEAGRVVVNVRVKEEQLVFSCTCSRGMKNNGCEHTICAVLVLKNLLIPEVFRPNKPKPVYRMALLTGLIGDTPNKTKQADAAGYSIILEQREDGDADVYVAANGERVTKMADLLRSPLIDFAAADLHFLQKTDALIRFLKRSVTMLPIVVKIEGEENAADFDAELLLEPFTELALTNNEVVVAKGLRDRDKRSIPFVRFGDLVYLPESGKLTMIEKTGGWSTWQAFNRALKETGQDNKEMKAQRFSIPVAVFDMVQQACATNNAVDANKDLLYTVNGEKARFSTAVFEPRLSIVLPDAGASPALLRPECVHVSSVRLVTGSCFRFFEGLNLRLPQYLKASYRKEALTQTYFKLKEAKTNAQAEKIINAALNDCDIEKSDMCDEARRILLRHQKEARTDATVLVQDGTWQSVTHDEQREAFLFKLPFEVFGTEIFDNMEHDSAMSVPVDLLYARLPLLCEKLTAVGIKLYMKGKPVRQSHWGFTIDATRKTRIDWFELKPEIRCDGNLLDDFSLDSLFSTRGIMENEDFIQISDSDTRHVLERLAAVYRVSDTRGKEESAVVNVPRLRILDWMELRKSGVTITLSPEDEEVVKRLLNFESIETRPLPKSLLATLRPYQRTGYDWLAFLYEHCFGACLADDMGLGKTVQVIAFLAGIKEGLVRVPAGVERLPHLIVVPPSLVFNWEHELAKFYPGLRLHLYTGAERVDIFDDSDVVLTTYGTVRRDIDKLKNRQFHVAIFDEAQAVKNIYADTTGAVRQLNAQFKISVTGTPVENHLGEYYSIVDLAVPGLLGEYAAFKPLIKSGISVDLDVIIKRTRPFVLRRTKEAVLTDLPAKTETDIYLDLTEDQKALYQKTVEQVRTTVEEAFQAKTAPQANIIALTAILKLRQICISPQLVDQGLAGVSPKMDFLIEQLQELMEENHSALVFSQFTSFLDILGKTLERDGIGYLRLDGSTPTAKRKTLVNQFQSSESSGVFLLSLKAGGQGLNLTKASYVFHLDPWWNPAVENQASDRAHRIGQKNKVTITRILMRHTIEEKMMELKKRKSELSDALLNDASASGSSLSITKEDFNYLLSSLDQPGNK